MRLIILLFLILPTSLFAFENTKVKINNFYIQKYEVTIAEYLNFANKTNFKTEAEKQGFGYEYGMGWEKDQKSTRLNSSHMSESRMPSSA